MTGNSNKQARGAGRQLLFLLSAAALATASGAAAQGAPPNPLVRDAFPIGDADGALCQVQSVLSDPAIGSMFDRVWTIVCRDSAQPVGTVFALRSAGALDRIAARPGAARCDSAGESADLISLPCTVGAANLPGRRLLQTVGDTVYVAEGYTAYGDALQLALASIRDQRVAQGTIRVATAGTGDAQALSRVQAASLPADRALAEGYRRNNSGDYAQAAVYFEALEQRDAMMTEGLEPTEFTLNRALQLSNLGDFAEAERLLAQVEATPSTDIVQLRLRRNFRAMHQLNQRDYEGVIATLDQPLATLAIALTDSDGTVSIPPSVAAGANAGSQVLAQLSAQDRLTPQERAILLDAQADQLRGTTLRLQGEYASARALLDRSIATGLSVRSGRVSSIIRMRAQTIGERALTAEGEGRLGEAERDLRAAIQLLEEEYPETLALATARAKLAAFLVRHGREDDALTNYRAVIAGISAQRRQLTGLYNQMAPYFALLVERQGRDPGAVAEFFAAAQLLVRPGVADTQALLARELSNGGGEAATLFRQANNLARDIERSRIALAQIDGGGMDQMVQLARDELVTRIANLSAEQTTTLTRLSAYPQYRAVSQETLALADLQAALRPGEDYAKLAIIGDTVYAMLVTPDGAQVWRASLSRAELDAAVDTLRSSISVFEGGRYVTYAFEAPVAARLYQQLFGPVAGRVAQSRHLIFEPDGAMLRLPLNLLITDPASVTAWQQRSAARGGDAFDMRGIAWLGRSTRVSTAVSALAFRNTRAAPPSRGNRAYLGMGNNLPLGPEGRPMGVRSGDPTLATGCAWSLAQWNSPISAAELVSAQTRLGSAGAEVLTGAAFTDNAVIARQDLADYRILHFATHGLVTPPRPDCPNRPALLTSFDSGDSDGLLSFEEIFGLRLDADIVILSACDTAGQASIAATRAAGVTTGGGSALDGLVRAFIGAGGRSVLASHWPAPDMFDATQRLIAGLFDAAPGTSLADALGTAQAALMDDARTSHPYYWSGFAIIGDGAQPIIAANHTTASAGDSPSRGAR